MLVSLATGLLATVSYGQESPGHASKQSGSHVTPVTRRLARIHEADGDMSQATFIRLSNIDTRVANDLPADPAEVRWAVGLLKQKPPRDTPENRHAVVTYVLGYLDVIKVFNLPERTTIMGALIPRLSDPEDGYREGAVLDLKRLGDRRAIPYLKPLLKDPSPDVRSQAAEALKSLSSQGSPSAAKRPHAHVRSGH